MLAGVLAVLVVGGVQPEGADGACPNEERRVEQGVAALALPDCRAYELVSRGANAVHERAGRASIDGDAVTYYAPTPGSDAAASSFFSLSTRGPEGWRSQSVGIQNAPGAVLDEECDQNLFFSPDLTKNIDETGHGSSGSSPRCKFSPEVVVPGETFLGKNLFLHDVAADSYQLVSVGPDGASLGNGHFLDASDDFSRILFRGSGSHLWADGRSWPIAVLPDGTQATGSLPEDLFFSGMDPLTGVTSADGRRIFFYSGEGLYLRLNADMPQSPVEAGECTDPELACTIQIDASQGPGPSGGGVFWRANPDASRVIFSSESKLTSDSTAVAGKADLYEYDLGTGQLVDLTVSAGEPADVRGISGAGEDLSYVYFVANGSLAPGASPGSCRNHPLQSSHICNLYVLHEGEIAFIATLRRTTDRISWQETEQNISNRRYKEEFLRASVSPSGRYLVFASMESLTGYDNRHANSGAPTRQIFLYDAEASEGAGQLSCVSCMPDGTRPVDDTVNVSLGGNYGPRLTWQGREHASWRINMVEDHGRVFFDTADPLVPEDTNGVGDAYLYQDGVHHLIAGNHSSRSSFVDASRDGSSVFFRTGKSLVSGDRDEEHLSVYVARIGGGLPQPPPLPPPCEGEGCRDAVPTLAPPALPATSSFQGPGNPKSTAKSKRRCRRGTRAQRRRCARVRAKRRSGLRRERARRTGEAQRRGAGK